jgi:hypothetical protein
MAPIIIVNPCHKNLPVLHGEPVVMLPQAGNDAAGGMGRVFVSHQVSAGFVQVQLAFQVLKPRSDAFD